MEHASVLEAGVIGVSDDELGHRIKMYIVLNPDTEPSLELARDIRQTLLEQIAPYKVPKIIEFISDLPKTTNGKIRRNQLREVSESEATGKFVYAF